MLRSCSLIALLFLAESSTAQEANSLQELLESVRQGEPDASRSAQLRIVNSGTEDIEDLTILFPDEEVEFGDIPVGVTTEYKDVIRGVYGYAAYRLEIDGQLVTQPVIDWVGEVPMDGMSFTYELALVMPTRRSWPWRLAVRLVKVTRDE